MTPSSTSPELITDTELGYDTTQEADPEHRIASAHKLDVNDPDDVDTPVEEPGSALLHETGLASPTPSQPTPIQNYVAGRNSEPCEQPMQDDDSASPRLGSP